MAPPSPAVASSPCCRLACDAGIGKKVAEPTNAVGLSAASSTVYVPAPLVEIAFPEAFHVPMMYYNYRPPNVVSALPSSQTNIIVS
ncbi:hypothetical protein KIN20_019063 [Parelaphostrongylus tenuis]|uniref:Uncharacterized protein n=1 Tax=Parelaphostrongylus tenuis TaxID=148309 RepID=A0AAD5N4D6_PARTN|nr:hypothetical protein KIN20_019063 [Parelaphostrongylus tenuis]